MQGGEVRLANLGFALALSIACAPIMPSYAEEPSDGPVSTDAEARRAALVARYAKALGYEPLIRSNTSRIQGQLSEQFAPVLAEYSKFGMSGEAQRQMQALLNELVGRMLSSVDPATEANIFASALAESMSDADLEAAISFYSTDRGRRAYSSGLRANQRVADYEIRQVMGAMKSAMPAILEQVRQIVADDRRRQTGNRDQSAAEPSKN